MLNEAKTSRLRPELRGQGRGQIFEAGAEAKILASRLNITGYNQFLPQCPSYEATLAETNT